MRGVKPQGPDFFAPTARRLAAEERSDTRRALIDTADRRSHLALKMSLAAGAAEELLASELWDGEWDYHTRRRLQSAQRKADLAWEQALDLALDAITEATAPALTNTNHSTTTTPENAHEPTAPTEGAPV